MWHWEATRYRTDYGSPLNYTPTEPLIRAFGMLAEHAEVLGKEVETAALLSLKTKGAQADETSVP